MGALSAPANWTVEDDILLKNAVETGASLESLAKGAVCFSHKFTIRELQDRWHSLLYDPDTSAQASARMVEYEIGLSTSNPAKANKLFNSKAKDFSFQKRKIDSVKNQYYAMRKRICNEPCSSTDLGFLLLGPCSCITTGGECACGGLLKSSQGHHLIHTIDPGANIVNCYGRSYSGGEHVFCEINGHHSFHTKHAGVADDAAKDGNTNNECQYGYSDVGQLYEHDYIQKNPHIGDGTTVSLKDIPNFQDPVHFQQVAASDHYGNEAREESKTLLGTDQDGIKHDHYSGDSNGRLPEPNSLQAIGQHRCSQPLTVPIWDMAPHVNAPHMLADLHIKEKEQEILTVANDKKMDTVNDDAVALQAKLDGGISDSGLDNAAMSGSEFMDFSFGEDFEILNGDNYLNSPLETNQDGLGDADAKVVMDARSIVHDLVHSDETNICYDQLGPNHEKHNAADVGGINLVSTSSEVPYPGRNVECKLNTEDPEIPCNDDIATSGQPPLQCSTSTWDQNSEHNTCSVSPATDPQSNPEHSNVSDLALLERENIVDAQPSSQQTKLNPSTLEQKEDLVALNKGCIAGAQLSEGTPIAGVLMHGSLDSNDANTCPSALHSINAAKVGEESHCDLGQRESFDNSQNFTLNKSIQLSDHMNDNSLDNKREVGSGATLQNCVSSHALSDLEFQRSVAARSTPGQAGEGSDNESNLPNYFDLEALILDQDLIPRDHESDFIHPEVSRFQYLESRKTLIRLEQGAQSYMNRAIRSRGAFAILYGHHLKYYMKDPEVTLGRETEDVKVDIDLGKEGKANKISRRQAVIKMDEGGSFHIKNIGKCSIFVNSKEVPCNKRINLSSDSLIEIRDMRFIFHVDQAAVRQHNIRTGRNCPKPDHKIFEFQPMN